MPLRNVARYAHACHRECRESTRSPTHAALIDTSAGLQQAVGVLSTFCSHRTLRSVQPHQVHGAAGGISKHFLLTFSLI